MHFIVLSRHTHNVEPLCITLREIVYCHEAHTIRNGWTEYCAVTTHTRCEAFVQKIALSHLPHDVKRFVENCTVATNTQCETVVHNIMLSRFSIGQEIQLQNRILKLPIRKKDVPHLRDN